MNDEHVIQTPLIPDEIEFAQTLLEPVKDWLVELRGAISTSIGFRQQPGSPLEADDEIVGGGLLRETAQLTIAAASDNLRSAVEMIRAEGGVPPVAAATLLRGTFEAASLSAWILMPCEREDRVVAVLRLHGKDFSDEFNFSGGDKAGAEYLGRIAQIRDVGAKVGAGPNDLKPVSSTETVRAFDDIVDLPLLQLWKLTSGFAHARRWAVRVLAPQHGTPTKNGTQIISLRGQPHLLAMAACDAAQAFDLVVGRWNDLSGNADAGTPLPRLSTEELLKQGEPENV